MNDEAIISQWNIDEHGNPISIKTEQETQVSVGGNLVQLRGIPDEMEGVTIEDKSGNTFFRVENLDEVYDSDYAYYLMKNGNVQFNPSQNGKLLYFKYYSKGVTLLSVSRIYYKDSYDNVVKILEDLIKAGFDALKVLEVFGGAKEVIDRLERDLDNGRALATQLEDIIAEGTPLQQNLHADITEAKKWKDSLHKDVAEGKILQPQLHQDVIDAKEADANLTQTINSATELDDKIKTTGNASFIIEADSWTASDDSNWTYMYTLTTSLNSSDLVFKTQEITTKGFEDCLLYSVVKNAKRIDFYTDNKVRTKVVVNARQYGGTIQDFSVVNTDLISEGASNKYVTPQEKVNVGTIPDIKQQVESNKSQLEETKNKVVSLDNSKLEKNVAETIYAKKVELLDKATKEELEVERARINQFTKLQEGSTTGDAELIDARVGADGEAYDTVGDAIRSQVTSLNNSLTNTTGFEKISMNSGYIYTNVDIGSVVNINPVSHDSFKHAIIRCVKDDCFLINARGGGNPKAWAFLDSNYKLLEASEYDVLVENTIIKAPEDGYVVINDKENRTSYKVVANNGDVGNAYLRRGLDFDIINGRIVIEEQRIVCGFNQFNVERTKLYYDTTKEMAILTFDIFEKTFKLKYSIVEKIASTEKIVAVFNLNEPNIGCVNGYYKVNGRIKDYNEILNIVKTENRGLENTINDWWIYPNAIRYNGLRDRTYVGYVSNNGEQGVIAINHKNGNIQRTALRNDKEIDDHNNPCVYINKNGKVCVMMTLHGSRPIHYLYVSKKAECIDEFDFYAYYMDDTGSKVNYLSYEQVMYCGGKYWLFSRVNRKTPDAPSTSAEWYWIYRTSPDGVNWSKEKYLLSAGNTQYYCLARVYDDNKIKLYMQANESYGHDIRLGFIDCNTMNVLNSDNNTIIQNIRDNTNPIPHTSFNTIVKDDNKYFRLYDVAEGTDLSFIYATRVDNADKVDTYYYTNGESHLTPSQGLSFGGSFGATAGTTYSNGACFTGTNKIALAIQKEGKWALDKYEYSNGEFVFVRTITETNSNLVKIMRPFSVANDLGSVVSQRGYYTMYNDFYADLELN